MLTRAELREKAVAMQGKDFNEFLSSIGINLDEDTVAEDNLYDLVDDEQMGDAPSVLLNDEQVEQLRALRDECFSTEHFDPKQSHAALLLQMSQFWDVYAQLSTMTNNSLLPFINKASAMGMGVLIGNVLSEREGNIDVKGLLNSTDAAGMTPLHHAKNNPATTATLLQYGANLLQRAGNLFTQEGGLTASQLAAQASGKSVADSGRDTVTPTSIAALTSRSSRASARCQDDDNKPMQPMPSPRIGKVF